MDKRLKKVLFEWKRECNIHGCLQWKVIYKKGSNMALKIFTSRPGIMIGYRGNMIDKYKPLIQEIYPQITSIEFEETDPDYLL